jgi:hypothetical protein
MNQNNSQKNQRTQDNMNKQEQSNKQNIKYKVIKNQSAIDLENLNLEYKSQLTAYKQAVSNYVNFLQKQSKQACIQYSPDSKGINQSCYDEIWKRSGCTTTGMVNSESDWAKSQTLDGLIYDSFLWATMTDSTHRDGCYGKNNTSDNTTYNTSTSADYDINKPKFTSIQGQTFWGTGQAGTQSVYTGGDLEQCKALCAKTSGCSGATFNPSGHQQPMCWLRTGEGDLAKGLDTDYAIVPEAKQYLMVIESINKKLLETNRKIKEINKKAEPEYNMLKQQNESQDNVLKQNYLHLNIERKKIKSLLDQYDTLDKSETQGNLKIYQKYYTFILLLIIAIGIIILFYKFSGMFTSAQSNSSSSSYIQQGGDLPQSTYMFVLIIIIAIILFNYFTDIQNTATGIGNGISNGFSSIFGSFGNLFYVD